MTAHIRQFSRIHAASISLILVLMFTGCEETIDLDLDQMEERIVIEAVVSDRAGMSNVRLSFTENIYKRSPAKKAVGAVVTLSDDLGNSEVLGEVQPGLYAPTKIQGIINREYKLNVAFEGVNYSAVSRMPEPMALDSVRTEVSGFDIFFGRSVTLTYYLTNKPGVQEFCVIRAYSPGEGTFHWDVYSDKNSDGRQAALRGPSFSASGTSVRVEVISIDKATYEYLRALEEVSGENGFELPDMLRSNDYNPKSNISNDALGYFSAQSQKDYVVRLR
jgi:hypothetical protein